MTPGCPDNCFSNEDNLLTLTGWMSEWNLLIRIAPEFTVNAIIALGYNDDPSLLYTVTRAKAYDWEKYQMLRRNVIHAFLFGEKAVGKVCLLRWVNPSPRCCSACCALPPPPRTYPPCPCRPSWLL